MPATPDSANRTGATLVPESLKAMTEVAERLTPVAQIDTQDIEALRLLHITEADAVGSVPPPVALDGVLISQWQKLAGGQPTILMDKLGERLAFERTGIRLYEALITKHKAALQDGTAAVLTPVVLPAEAEGADQAAPVPPADVLMRLRADELAHFALVAQAIRQLGGDPTAQTPCADVSAVASMGILQVLHDPRTTLAQCLNAMLTAELTDNAGWELLIQLTKDAGEAELAGQFTEALAQEARHLDIIKTWLNDLVASTLAMPQAMKAIAQPS
jgi:rubrerythrin